MTNNISAGCLALALSLTAICALASDNHIIVMGDNLAIGSADTTVVSTATPTGGKMFSSGLRNADATGSQLLPLKESVSGKNGETACTGMVEQLNAESSTTSSYLCYVAGKENAPIADFAKGGTLYGRVLTAVTAGHSLQGATQKVLGIAWMQGNNDVASYTPQDKYYQSLVQLQSQLSSDIKAITGQGEEVPMVIAQVASQSWYHHRRGDNFADSTMDYGVANAQLKACIEKPGEFIFATPLYPIEYGNDMISPTAESEKIIGAYEGYAMRRALIDGHPQQPIHVTAVDATANTAKITFQVPVTPLTLDTTQVGKADNYGFSILRGTGANQRSLNITSIALTGAQTLSITCDENLAYGDIIAYGAGNAGVGAQAGARGNLRDSQGDTKAVNVGCRTYKLHNWCPLFSYTIGAVTQPASVNVTGQISCYGVGVPNVAVSDGYATTTTDAAGYYYLTSEKKNGYVFYTLPSGYEPEVSNGYDPKFWEALSTDVTAKETHNFTLKKADNESYKLIVGTDIHLANRTSDVSQFTNGFAKHVKDFVASHPQSKVYSFFLGDMAWDAYWTSNKYDLTSFMTTLTDVGYPTILFPVMGNHDNDPSIPAGTDCDFLASGKFRSIVAPNYYSFNLGKVHYISLDNIVYKNEAAAGATYGTGIAGSRNYDCAITAAELEWLKKDLALVTDKNTPIVIGLHSPCWNVSTDGTFTSNAYLTGGSNDKLGQALADFPTVHLLTGHTHYNYHSHPAKYGNIHENNVAAVCATWWWTGKLTGRQICKDGSPGGYEVFDVNGDDISWRYNSTETGDDSHQFRAYDMNTVRDFYATDSVMKVMLGKYSKTNYANIGNNVVYVNVFNYDTDWKVEVMEDGTPLAVSRIVAEDPMHVICYDYPRFKANKSYTSDFGTNKTAHMFKATATTADKPITIRVTDSFGNENTETMIRPKAYTSSMQ